MSGTAENELKAYTYTVFVEGQNVSVTGRLPREWLVSTGSEWAGNAAGTTLKELAEGMGGTVGAMGSTAASFAATVGGANIGFTALSNRQWTGGQPITFNLLAEFVAHSNALEDVLRPAIILQSMAMPTTVANPVFDLPNGEQLSAGGVIGPAYWQTLKDSQQVGGRSLIKLRLGEMFVFDDMIVENVTLNKSTQLAKPGIPIKITAEIQIATRGPITFQQYVSYMTGAAIQELFDGNDIISEARDTGAGKKAGLSKLETTAPTR